MPFLPPRRIALFLVLLFAAVVRAPMIGLRFDRNSEATGAFVGIQARNYLRLGVLRTAFVPAQSIGVSPVAGDPPTLYANHPPLEPLLVGVSYKLFGDGEWQTRLPGALFTLGCVAMVFLLLRDRAGPRAAAMAALLFAAVPISVRYGGQSDVINSQLVFFALLSVAGYLRWQDEPSAGNFARLAIPFALAAMSDWPAFFLCPILAAHFCLTHPPRRWLPMAVFAGFCAVLLLGLYAYLSVVAHDWGLIPRNILRRSIHQQSDREGMFDFKRWLWSAVVVRNAANHTIVVIVLAVAWCVAGILKTFKTHSDSGIGSFFSSVSLPAPLLVSPSSLTARAGPGRRSTLSAALKTGSEPGVGKGVVWILLGWGGLHVIIGRQGTFVHDWWWWPLTAGVTMAAGLAIDGGLRWVEARWVGSAKLARGMTMMAVFLFAAVISLRTIVRSYQPENIFGQMRIEPGPRFTTAELGAAVRAAAPVDSAVVVAENDDEPSVWYYCDRPLIMNVWDPITLEWRNHAGWTDLPFGFTQQWSAMPVACVVPRRYEAAAGPLLESLRESHPSVQLPAPLGEKFWAFDLRRVVLREGEK